MNGDFLRFVLALGLAAIACAALLGLAHLVCWVEHAILQRQAVARRLSQPPFEVTEIGGRRRAAGQLLGQGATWMLALFAGVVLGLIIWRVRH